MIIEILIGIGLAIGLYWLQDRTSKDVKKMTERIDKLTQQKAKAEQDKKAFECWKIIEHLQVIQDAERSLKTFLTGYKIGDHTNETLKSIYGMSLDGIAINRINKMKDGIEQLQSRLNDNTLREDFLNYLGAFYVLPDRILKHNFPQQPHQLDYLLHFVDDQLKKIEEFIDRFNREMDFS